MIIFRNFLPCNTSRMIWIENSIISVERTNKIGGSHKFEWSKNFVKKLIKFSCKTEAGEGINIFQLFITFIISFFWKFVYWGLLWHSVTVRAFVTKFSVVRFWFTWYNDNNDWDNKAKRPNMKEKKFIVEVLR